MWGALACGLAVGTRCLTRVGLAGVGAQGIIPEIKERGQNILGQLSKYLKIDETHEYALNEFKTNRDKRHIIPPP